MHIIERNNNFNTEIRMELFMMLFIPTVVIVGSIYIGLTAGRLD